MPSFMRKGSLSQCIKIATILKENALKHWEYDDTLGVVFSLFLYQVQNNDRQSIQLFILPFYEHPKNK